MSGYPSQQPYGMPMPQQDYQNYPSGYPNPPPAGFVGGGAPPDAQAGMYPPTQQQGGYPAYPQQAQQQGYPAYPQQQQQPSNTGYPAYPSQPMQGGYSLQQSQGTYPSSQQQGGYAPSPQYGSGGVPSSGQGYSGYSASAPPYQSSPSVGYPGATPTPSYQHQQYNAPGGLPAYGQQPGGAGSYPGQYSSSTSQYPAPTPAQSIQYHGTVKPFPNFNANSDAEVLRKAMKGFGCDDKAIVDVLCKRTNAQRQQIRNAFKVMYGKDLANELISELRGRLEDVIIALMYLPEDYDAMQLRKAMEGLGTKESTVIEVMCTRTNAQIHALKAAYARTYGRHLEQDLQSETSGHFKRLLTSLSVGGRDESTTVNPQKAAQDAQTLYRAGEGRLGTDESAFNAVLCAQSPAQLRLVFEEYQKLARHDIERAIMNEFSGDILDGMLSVVKAMRNRPALFAELAYRAMKGAGTNDNLLIRVIVTRCEVDMVEIKQEFQRMYGKTLESFIADDTSGNYKNALLTLVRGN